jgi:hypothetical protein
MEEKPGSNSSSIRRNPWFDAIRKRVGVAAGIGLLVGFGLGVMPYWNSFAARADRRASARETVRNDNWTNASYRVMFGCAIGFALGLCNVGDKRHRSFRLTRD